MNAKHIEIAFMSQYSNIPVWQSSVFIRGVFVTGVLKVIQAEYVIQHIK